MKNNNILVLGYFGYCSNQLDGQTIKTRSIYKLLQNESNCNVIYFDTQGFKYNKTSIFTLFKNLTRIKKLVYLPAHGNLKYLFPIIFIFSKCFKFDIHYFVIGGWLPEYLEKMKFHQKLLKIIKNIYSETDLMKSQLESQGFKNVRIFRNFRFNEVDLSNHHKEEISINNISLKCVFFSRINKMKGLETVFKFGEFLKGNRNIHITVDFYGQVAVEDKEYFYSNLGKCEFFQYQGELQPDLIHNKLSQYDLLLFPTRYYTEGLPGTIIDAYMAGVPVVASNWKHASEFVKDGRSGLIFNWDDPKDFVDKIMVLYNDRNKLNYLKNELETESEKYTDLTAWRSIQNDFNCSRIIMN